MSALAIGVAAEAVAIAIAVTGPPESPGFSARLPLLVLAVAAVATAARWRRAITLMPGEIVARSLLRTRRIPLSSVASVRARATSLTLVEHNGATSTIRFCHSAPEVAEAIDAALLRSPAECWYAGPPPVPMATPWLVLNSSAGVAFLAAKGYENHPALVTGLLGVAGLAGLVALGGCVVEWFRAQLSHSSLLSNPVRWPYN